MLACIASSAVGHGLAPLPELVSTDLHFVADDWSGAGNWTSRDSNAWVAVKTGSPTKAASSFAGRSQLSGFSGSAFFSVAAGTAHALIAGTSFTYEVILKFPGDVTDSVALVAGSALFSSGAATASIYSLGGFYSGDARARDGAGTYVAAQFGNFATTGRYYLFTWVYNGALQKSVFYVNGVAQGSEAAWDRDSPAGPLSITFDMGCSAAFTSAPFNNGGAILEVLRHRAVLDAGAIASRATQFNALRGY